MFIQVHTDNNVEGREELARRVEARLRRALDRFGPAVTAVDVHLGDDNAAQPGETDKRCLIEVRLANRNPEAAQHNGATIEEAVRGASLKIRRRLDSSIGRISNKKGAPTIRKPGTIQD
jgi:Sigma 54 modulation protein / S30EA ribosomal protein